MQSNNNIKYYQAFHILFGEMYIKHNPETNTWWLWEKYKITRLENAFKEEELNEWVQQYSSYATPEEKEELTPMSKLELLVVLGPKAVKE